MCLLQKKNQHLVLKIHKGNKCKASYISSLRPQAVDHPQNAQSKQDNFLHYPTHVMRNTKASIQGNVIEVNDPLNGNLLQPASTINIQILLQIHYRL